jgi:hypothetical protein
LGIATTRTADRVCAAVGMSDQAQPQFLCADNVCNAGVLFIVPALISQGLLKVSSVLSPLRKGYYGLMSVLLTLAFMFLSRIKCPEQLKTCKVGELGKLIGLDRVPEAKCLRGKIAQISSQGKTDEIGNELLHQWMSDQDCSFVYIDGHVRVYHGHTAHLAKRYVSREKLCLAGTTDFWINDEFGTPLMVVTAELNESLKTMILDEIVPRLLVQTQSLISEEALAADADLARFTMVFDREAYELGFFKQLWDMHRIAVLTYRKAVKDQWSEDEFSVVTTKIIGKDTTMMLCEKAFEHEKCTMREIRKRSENGHQTSIVTTNKKMPADFLAGKMFSRWSQENFFRYMVQDYDIDKLVEYGVEEVDPETEVVNPSHRSLSSKIKKNREKTSRLKAKLFAAIEENIATDIDRTKQVLEKQSNVQELIAQHDTAWEKLKEELKNTPKYIKIKDMAHEIRYNKLKTESKLFMNTMKMIVYRAETAVTNIISPFFSRSSDEIRMLVKEIIKSDADLIPDYTNKTLTVRLHTLSTPRANNAVRELCSVLNDTETIYPQTDLRLIYEMVSIPFTGSQEI